MGGESGLRAKVTRLESRVRELEAGLGVDPIAHAIAYHSPNNITLLDRSGTIQYMNHAVPGVNAEKLRGCSIYSQVSEQLGETIRRTLARVSRSLKPDRYETSYVAPDGTRTWWESNVGPVIQEGVLTGFAVISTDVSEQRRQADEQERFFELSVDLLGVAGFDGYFKRVNRAFEATLGYTTELLTRPILDFVHPEDVDSTVLALQRLGDGDTVLDFENRYRTRTGSYRLLAWRAIADPERELMYGAARDITEQRELESKLRQSQRMEAVGKLAGGIAHDFNNLLLAIQANIELARDDPSGDPSPLEHAMLATDRAATPSQPLLAFSRYQAIMTGSVDAVATVKRAMAMLERLLPEHIDVQVSYQAPLPPVLADRVQLEQVVVNLCVNARDAMPDGGALRIGVRHAEVQTESATARPVGKVGSYIVISVTDTGMGMPAEVQSHLFEPFFTTKSIGEGTGLGLSLVYGIVQHHGGYLEVRSEPGRGSTLEVYLPVTQEPASTPTSDRPAAAHGGVETVLVAEDDPAVRQAVVKLLERAGYNVLTAADGVQAVQQVEQHEGTISAVLLDVVMPQSGGPAAAARIRELRPDAKIMFTSGHIDSAHHRAQLAGEVVLGKPYLRDDLLRALREALDGPPRDGY